MTITEAHSRGNARKQVASTSAGPWKSWSKLSRANRCIRFIETYCRIPKGYGAGNTIKLAPYQKRWLRKVLAKDVSSAVMSIPRGNGKSTFLAAVAIWAVFDDDESGGPQVPIVATAIHQAVRTVYGVALAMISAEPELASRAMIYSAIGAMRVYVPATGGEMFPVSSSPDGLQGLDPSLAVCDEIGFISIESWDSLLLASGKRPRSLIVGIGTPGLDKDNALWHLRSRVTEGAVVPGFLFTEYAADPSCVVTDEKAWAGANPALKAGYMNVGALRTAVQLSPEGHFRIFRLGQWVDGVESWLGDDGRSAWDALYDPYDFRPGQKMWVGIDVGLKRDSTAVVAGQRRPDGRLHLKARVWMPAPGEPVDVTDVMAYLRNLDATYDLAEVPFDPRFFDVPAKILTDEGLPMLEIPQSIEYMTPAIGTTLELIKNAQISHDGDDVFTTHVLNAVARYNERGFTLAKAKSRGKIDACIAMCLAAWRATQRDVVASTAWVSFA